MGSEKNGVNQRKVLSSSRCKNPFGGCCCLDANFHGLVHFGGGYTDSLHFLLGCSPVMAGIGSLVVAGIGSPAAEGIGSPAAEGIGSLVVASIGSPAAEGIGSSLAAGICVLLLTAC